MALAAGRQLTNVLITDHGRMNVNEEPADIVLGRTVELVTKEEGLVTILFNDHSTLQIKTIGGPSLNMLGEGRIKGVGEVEQH